MQDVSPAGEASHVYPLTRAWTTSTLHAGQFTAACGVTIYRGDLLGDAYYGNSFTCEPTANLVHRDALEPQGATFRSKTADAGARLSRQPRRMVPSGESRERPRRRSLRRRHVPGRDRTSGMGARRIETSAEMNGTATIAGGFIASCPPISIASRDNRIDRSHCRRRPPTLVSLLDHANSWHRETAARLLYERQDKSARPALELLASRGDSPSRPRSRPLCTRRPGRAIARRCVESDGGCATPAYELRGVQLGRRWLTADPARSRQVVPNGGSGAEGRVRFEVALALGDVIGEPAAVAALARVAITDRARRMDSPGGRHEPRSQRTGRLCADRRPT